MHGRKESTYEKTVTELPPPGAPHPARLTEGWEGATPLNASTGHHTCIWVQTRPPLVLVEGSAGSSLAN